MVYLKAEMNRVGLGGHLVCVSPLGERITRKYRFVISAIPAEWKKWCFSFLRHRLLAESKCWLRHTVTWSAVSHGEAGLSTEECSAMLLSASPHGWSWSIWGVVSKICLHNNP